MYIRLCFNLLHSDIDHINSGSESHDSTLADCDDECVLLTDGIKQLNLFN